MSTIEKLFVQIFERKRWIVDQVKQQSDLYDQFLASNCLIHGIRPPSWLLTSGFQGAGSAEVKELKREDLISGLFFPPPRHNQPSNVVHNTVCNKVPFSENIVQDSDVLCTGASASQSYFDVGHNSIMASKCHLNYRASVGVVSQLNNATTSPLDQMEARTSDSNVQLDQSFMKIQRSRSRQKALEIRKSGEAKSARQPHTQAGLKSADNLLPPLDSVKENKHRNILDNQSLSQSFNLVQMENVMEANREKHPSSRVIVDECAEGLLQPDKSDEVSSGRVTHSRPTSRNKYSQPDTRLNMIEGYDVLRASDTESIGMLGSVGDGDAQMDNSEFSVLDPPLGDDIYVEPKQLFFDEAEECSLIEQFTPHSENKKVKELPDKARSLEFARSLSKEIVSNGLNERQDAQFVEKDENLAVMSRDEEVKASSGGHEEHGLGFPGIEKSECNYSPVHSRKSLNTSARSSRKRPSAIDEDVLVDLLPENSGTSKKETIGSIKKSATSNNSCEKSCLNAVVEFRERDHVGVMDMEEERNSTPNSCEEAELEITEGGSEFHFHPVVASVKMSNVSALSPQRGTSDIHGNGMAATFSGENNIVKQEKALFDHLITSKVVNTSSLRTSLQGGVDRDLLNLNMDMANVGLCETCTKKLDAGASGVSPESCKPVNISDAPENSLIPEFNRVPRFSVCNEYELSLRDQTDFVDEADVADKSVLTHSITPNSAKISSTRREIPYLLRSDVKHDKEDDFSKADESPFGDIQVMNSVNSWPPCKRRKVDGQSSNMLSRFSRVVSVEQLQNIDESGILEFHRNVEDGIMSDQDFKHANSSSDANAAYSNVIERVGARLCRSASSKRERYGPLPRLEAKQGNPDVPVGEKGPKSLGLNQTSVDPPLLSSLNTEECEHVQDNPSEVTDIGVSQLASKDHPYLMFSEDKLHLQNTEERGSVGGLLQETETVGREMLISYSLVMSPNFEDVDPFAANQSMPELEGFDICLSTEKILPLPKDKLSLGKMDLPTTTCERIRVLEKLCRSTGMLTPLPQSSNHKIQRKPDVSLPNGLLECRDLRNNVHFNNEGFDQLMESYTFEDSEPDLTFDNGCKASSEFQFSWGVEKLPPTPPPVRFLDQITASTPTCHSYEKQKSVNPELTCFRIDEDTSTSEENWNFEEQTNIHGGISPRDSNSSSCRRPLVDMTNSKTLPSISVSKNVYDRGSIDSVNTEPYMHRTQINAKLNQGSSHGKGRRVKRNKESQSSSIGGNEIQKASGSRCKMSPKLLRKASEENKSQSFLNTGCRRGNIVSNVSSFVPLLQQKQRPVAIAAGKRDVKVKALEAAEAAKRLEEKRENDRKMKKEAAKLERARLEEEKSKQLELKKKNNEEERKKKDAEKAARKRLREEEDKKEKEKKRACTEEARRQQNEQSKYGAQKEQRGQLFRPAVEKEGKKRDLRNEEKKHEKPKKGSHLCEFKKKIDTGSTVNVAAENTKKASEVHENSEVFKEYRDKVEKEDNKIDLRNEEAKHQKPEKGSQLFECKEKIYTGTSMVNVEAENTKIVSNLCETESCSFSFTEGTGEQSYEISPYQVSDDEEEEQDLVPHKKFIPSWAREKHLTSIMPSEQVDPCKIFLPTRICTISEMLLSRINSK